VVSAIVATSKNPAPAPLPGPAQDIVDGALIIRFRDWLLEDFGR
jgi:hypothetical protein